LLKPAAVDDVIGAVEKLIAPLIRDKEIAFSVKKGPGVPLRIVTDEEKIHQVLLNLLGNAVKFTPRGEIRLEVDAREEKLYFEVHDTGIGISEAHLPYIFETFTQVDGSVSGEYGGTGLGLALCKKLVTLLKGEIDVRSQVGRGSVFTFYIPLTVPPTPPAHLEQEL
jgi:signal transduction histidine kinase